MITGGNYTFDKSYNVNRIDSAKTTGVFDLSQASEAAAEDAFLHSPTRSLYGLAKSHGLTGVEEGQHLDSEALKQKKNTDFYAQFIQMPEEGMSEREYNFKYEAVRKEKLRENAMMRAPDTMGQFVKMMGVSLGTAMLDPTSIGLGYLPATIARAGYIGAKLKGVAEGYDASMAASTALGRAGLRTQAGAVGGTFEGAVGEAPVYYAAQNRDEKYTANDVLLSITTGIAVGSGIQVTGGALFDLGTIEARAFEREKIRVDKENEAVLEAKKLDLEAKRMGVVEDHLLKLQKEKELNAIPDNLLKFSDPDFIGPIPLSDYEDYLHYALLKASDTGGLQRKLSSYTPEERAALMQTNLAQMLEGKEISANEFVDSFEARRLGDKFNPMDVDKVRAEVEAEIIRDDMDLKRVGNLTESLKSIRDENTNILRNEISALEGKIETFKKLGTSNEKRQKLQKNITALKSEVADLEIAVLMPKQKGMSKNKRLALEKKEATLKDKQAELEQAQRDFEPELEGERSLAVENTKRELALKQQLLDDHRRGFHIREQYSKRLAKRINSLIKGEDAGIEINKKVNAEVQRRMDIIDEIHMAKPEYNIGQKTDLSQGIKKSFTAMKSRAESPETSRTHRPNAEAEQAETGRRTAPTEDTAKLEQEKTDAIENAQLLAEADGNKYEMTKQEMELIDTVEQMKTSVDRLSVCMGRAA